jgi:hypothetical protein
MTRLRPRTIQYILASVFLVLGGWCLLAPRHVIELCITEAFRSDAPLAVFAVACFGAQAMIAALFAAFSRFTRATFFAYGLALLPFFVFDWWFYAVTPMLTEVGLLDAAGNVLMLALCFIGWRNSPKTEPRR